MDTETPTSPARKTYCVWADCQARCYQHVQAASPEEAFRLAEENPDGWEFCSDGGDNDYRLSGEVGDLATGEVIDVRPQTDALGGDTPWVAEPSGDGFFRIVNSRSVVLAEKCVQEEAELFALAPELLERCRQFVAVTETIKARWQSGDLAGAVNDLAAVAEMAEEDIAAAERR